MNNNEKPFSFVGRGGGRGKYVINKGNSNILLINSHNRLGKNKSSKNQRQTIFSLSLDLISNLHIYMHGNLSMA